MTVSRQKQHFRIRTSISSHPSTAGMWADPLDRGIYCELGRLAIVKFAADHDDEFLVSASEMMGVTGCKTPSASGRRIESWAKRMRLAAESLGSHLPVTTESPPSHSGVTYESPPSHLRVTYPVTVESVGSHWKVRLRNLRKVQEFKTLTSPKPGTPEDRGQKTEDKGQKTKDRRQSSDRSIAKTKEPPPGDCVSLAEHLVKRILELQPARKIPTCLDSWAWVYEKTIRIDKRSEPDLRSQIDWLFGPLNQGAQARFEVFSAGSHREKFDRIESIRQRASNSRNGREAKPVLREQGMYQEWQN